MRKCLFIICPTDCIESIINKTFECESYFYTSLGNAFIHDHKTIQYLNRILQKHAIKHICFVLSFNNTIVLDAIGSSKVSNISILNHLYKDINHHQSSSKLITTSHSYQFTVFSYHLNDKIKTLKCQLNAIRKQTVTIQGKIYNRQQNIFNNIYSDLLCLERHHLN